MPDFQKCPKLVPTSFSMQISMDFIRSLFLPDCSPKSFPTQASKVKINPQNISFKFYFQDGILVMELNNP